MSHRTFERILHFRVSPGSMSVSVSVKTQLIYLFDRSEYEGLDSSSPLKRRSLCSDANALYKGVHASCFWNLVLICTVFETGINRGSFACASVRVNKYCFLYSVERALCRRQEGIREVCILVYLWLHGWNWETNPIWTWYQTRLPAEFKHITKRRKRN